MAAINSSEVRLSVTSNPSLIFVGKASVHPGGATNIKRVDSDERCKFDPIKLYNPGPTWGVVQILIRGFFQRKKSIWLEKIESCHPIYLFHNARHATTAKLSKMTFKKRDKREAAFKNVKTVFAEKNSIR
jgi:hypothetical protein